MIASSEERSARGGIRIARPRITRAIEDALRSGALLLEADAGFGKTVALEDALAELRLQSVWVRCTTADRAAGRLLVSLVAALRPELPGADEVFGDRVASGLDSSEPHEAVQALVEELGRLAPRRLVIVFDDAEALRGSAEATALLEALLARADGRLGVAVSTRVPLDLRSARLRAADRVTELTARELALTFEECAGLLAEVRGRAADDEEIDALWRAAEGWPLGSALLAQASRRPGADPVGPDVVFGFLAEELLGRFEESMRDAVVDSAVPAELDDRMVAALGLPPDFLAVASAALGVFLRPLGGRQWTFSYHPLFRAFLLDRLRRDRPAQRRRELHAAAAEAFAAADRRLEAMEHWIEAERWSEAALALTALDGDDGPDGPVPDALARLAVGLPPEMRAEPAIGLATGIFEWSRCRYRSALAPLADAAFAFDERGDRARAQRARMLHVDCLYEYGLFEEAIATADRFRDESQVQILAGAAEGALGRIEAGRARFRAAGRDAATPFAQALEAAGLDTPAGAFDRALARARGAAAALEAGDPLGLAPYVHGALAHVLEVVGQDGEALAELERALTIAEAGSARHVMPYLQMLLPGYLVRAGQLDRAEIELARADAVRGDGWVSYDLELTRAVLARRRGDHETALLASDAACEIAARAPIAQLARAAIVRSRIAVWTGNAELALRTLDAVPLTEELHGARAFLLAARAGAAWAAGDPDRALEDLARAWDAPDSAHHVVRREWSAIEPVLALALERGTLDPAAAVGAAAAAGRAARLIELCDHPRAAVRRAVALPVAESGHPDAAERLDLLGADVDASVADVARTARRRLIEAPPPLAFRLLGGFEARRGSYEIGLEAWNRPAAARLVRLLLINRDELLSEDALFEAFWPDRSLDAARRSLQVVVSRARAALDPPEASSSLIDSGGRLYRIRLRPVDSVDVDDFEAAAAAALSERGPARRALLERAEQRWRGEPLAEDRYASWAAPTRERLIDLYAGVLGELSEIRAGAGDWPGTIDLARRRLALDPLDETAHRDLMAAYARSGRRGHALHQFLECRRTLVDQLGVEPSSATAELHAKVLAGEPV